MNLPVSRIVLAAAVCAAGGCGDAAKSATSNVDRLSPPTQAVPVAKPAQMEPINPPPAPPQKPESKEPPWLDASQQAAELGAAKVQIVEARIGDITTVSGIYSPTKKVVKNHLVITIRVHNVSDSKKISFARWHAADFEHRARIKDDFGNVYTRYPFSMTSMPEGVEMERSLYPGQAKVDIVVFEPPVGKATELFLELPAKGFGEKGSVRFRIPLGMVKK